MIYSSISFSLGFVTSSQTKSLYDVVEGVIAYPKTKFKPMEQDMLPLARVLLALSNMAHTETKGAPFTVLSIKDREYHESPSSYDFAELLMAIWKAGKNSRKYNKIDFGIRITDAGYTFVRDWQASFSFMAALYCFSMPSLFYLKRATEIESVITNVYKAATAMCELYEKEARTFCNDEAKFYNGEYILTIDNQHVPFIEQVKRNHTQHLIHYKAYIEKNWQTLNIPENDVEYIKRIIDEHISKYSILKTEGEGFVCF